MKENTSFKQKKSYITPQFTLIVLDNEISLQLESTPPSGPDEVRIYQPESNMSDSFKNLKV